MNKKIIGIFVMTLLIGTVLPATGSIEKNSYLAEKNEPLVFLDPMSSKEIQYIIVEANTESNRDKSMVQSTNGEVIDQDFSDHIGWGMRFIKNSNNAQSFTPSLDTLTKIEIPFFAHGTPPEDSKITMVLKSDLESEEILASMTIDANQIEHIRWIEFDIQDISVVPETEYFIICESTTEDFDNNYYCWVMGLPDVPYLRGDAWIGSYYQGNWNWLEYSGEWDFCFRTYGILEGNNPPETPSKPMGPDRGKLKVNYSFSTSTTDPENDIIYY